MTNTITFSPRMDVNGNACLQIKPSWFRAFNIQTNGSLPRTHRNLFSNFNLTTAHQEIAEYIQNYGTKNQKRIFEKTSVILKRGKGK